MGSGRSDSRSKHHRRHRSRSQSPSRRRHRERDEDEYRQRASKKESGDRHHRRRDEEAGSGSRPVREPDPPKKEDKPAEPKLKVDFSQSGKLAEDTNTFNGVVVKYNEPADAKQPKRKWRLYPFKGDQSLDFIPIHNQSAYLMGRDRRVADIPIDHPSCSMQHAAIQFRAIQFEREDGSAGKRVRPYLIDLESSNGTFLNNKRIEGRKYYELFDKDVIKFGFSSRDYVVMHEDYKEQDEVNE